MAVIFTWLATSQRKGADGLKLLLPHEDNVLNKFRILKERHVQLRKPYQSPGRMKNSSYYIAPVGDRTHDLPHNVASNMVKVSGHGGGDYCIRNTRYIHVHSTRRAIYKTCADPEAVTIIVVR